MLELVSYLNKRFSLSVDASQQLASLIRISEIGKGTTFVRSGKINTDEYLILDGICRSFVMNPNGEDVTLSFFTSDSAISPNLTRTESGTSIINIQALTDVRLAFFSSVDLMTSMGSNREIENWANGVLQNELLQKVRKEINQNSLKAKERLISFRLKYPSLENHIAHSYIASYLGISNVTLSRLRREISLT